MNFDKYINFAKNEGAVNAVKFNIADIVFDPRVALKCIFGCGQFGKAHTCPFQRSPLSFEQYKETLLHFNSGIIIQAKNKKISQHVSYEIERMAFLDGHYFAFSLSDCGLCKECSKVYDKECVIPTKARPSFHGVGIDVFATVAKYNLPLRVAKTKDDDTNWYSAVFID